MGKHVRRRKRLGTIGALGMLVLLVFAAVNMGYTILILIGMAPAIVAYIVDHGREKTATLCVGLLNFCGVLPFAIELYRNFDSSPDGALTILNTPGNWLVMYGAAAAGWAVYSFVPPMIAKVIVTRTEHRRGALEKRIKTLFEIWGEDVAKGYRPK